MTATTATIDLTALTRPVTGEELMTLATPFLTIGPDRVWRWMGDGAVGHTVHTHRLGLVEWTVWVLDHPVGTRFRTLGEDDTAELLIARMRRSGADALLANAVLRADGYGATQHVGRPDCNCEGCQPGVL